MLQQAREKIRQSSGETVKTLPILQQRIASKLPQKPATENQPSIETTDDDVDDEEEEFSYEDEDENQGQEEIKTTSEPNEGNKPVILTSNFILPGKPIPNLEHHYVENPQPNDLSSDISVTNEQEKDNAEDVIDSIAEELVTEKMLEKTTKKIDEQTTKVTSTIKPAHEDPNVEYEYEYVDYEDEPATTEIKFVAKPVTGRAEQTTVNIIDLNNDNNEQQTFIDDTNSPDVTTKTEEKTIKSNESDEQIETSVGPMETSSIRSTTAEEVTTEGSVIVASVQTSRSTSGARYLTFPQFEQEAKKQSLSDSQKDVKKLIKDEDYNNENNSDDSYKSDDLVASDADKSTITKQNVDLTEASHENSDESITDSQSGLESESGIELPQPEIMKTREQKLSSISEKLAHLHEFKEPKPELTTKSIPVVIRKFTPRTTKPPKRPTSSKTFTTTSKEPNLHMDVELASLLPTAKTTTTVKVEHSTPTEKNDVKNFDEIIAKNIQFKEISLGDLLPKDYKPMVENVTKNESNNVANIKFVENIDAILPKDFKPTSTVISTTKAPFRLSTVTEDISKFLPPGFKVPKETIITTTTTKRPLMKTTMDDISKFLPPGFKLPRTTTTTTTEKSQTPHDDSGSSFESVLNKLSFNADIASLLPPGFKANASNDESASSENKDDKSTSTSTVASTGNSSFKLVFPKGFGKRPGVRMTTPRPSHVEGPSPPGINIRKGLPTR